MPKCSAPDQPPPPSHRRPTSSSAPSSKLPAETHQTAAEGQPHLTTNEGLPLSDNQNSLKAGIRGPVLLECFILRESRTACVELNDGTIALDRAKAVKAFISTAREGRR